MEALQALLVAGDTVALLRGGRRGGGRGRGFGGRGVGGRRGGLGRGSRHDGGAGWRWPGERGRGGWGGARGECLSGGGNVVGLRAADGWVRPDA